MHALIKAITKSKFAFLMPLLMQTAIGIVLVLFFWLIVINLPMLQEISLPLQFTLAELLSAVVLMVMAVMLFQFGWRMKLHLNRLAPGFLPGGALLVQLIYPIAVLLIYFAIRPLSVPYLGSLAVIYHLLFLVVFLVLLALLLISIYRHAKELNIIFSASGIKGLPAASVVVCGKCGAKNTSAVINFCSACGTKMFPTPRCKSCGKTLAEGSKFCSGCGAAVDGAGEVLSKKA